MNEEDVMNDSVMLDMIGRTFRHFKTGGIYTVLGFTMNSETLQPSVIYRNVDSKKVWDRPYSMFNEKVTLPDGSTVRRFQRIDFNK